MGLLVALTGGAGLLASWGLWHAGMHAMVWRYPVAVALAYLVFLGLLWLWLRTSWSDYGDLIDPSGWTPSSSSGGSCSSSSSTTSFDASSGSSSDASGVGDAIGEIAMADEAAIPLAVIAVLIAACLALFVALASVVWSAPVLFAEILFDGVLAVGLYRRLRRGDAQHWVQTAVRHTVWPFALVVVFSALTGAALQWYAPDATTWSQALEHRPVAADVRKPPSR